MHRTHLDLFSGIGGFALACRWAGVETVGFAEIDDYASRVLAKNFPGVTNYGDVRNVPGGLSTWLVTGGFPCQPYSVAGKQRGATDDRHIWPEMARVVERAQPTWVLAENVPGIVRMELDTVLSDLERLDYTACPVIVPACAVDAPHRRERVWIVAHTDRAGLAQREGVTSNARAQQPAIVGGCDAARKPDVWQPEPGVGRVAHGVPRKVDRLRGLGNAIVPQVAYQLIRMMIAAEEATT